MFDLVQEPDEESFLSERTIVYVITHGVCSGGVLGNLTDQGKKQISDLARSRVAVGVNKIFASPDDAAVKSAGILRKEFEVPVKVMECLKTIPPGNKAKSIEEIGKFLISLWTHPKETGDVSESLFKARQRLGECFNTLSGKSKGQSIAVVVPPLVGTLFYSLVVGGELSAMAWLDAGFASCGTYEYSQSGWALMMPPDDSFLPDPISVRNTIPPDILEKLEE